MSHPSDVLDGAFDRLAASGFELPNGFVNHGPMACEALSALGLVDEVDDWARRFARSGGTAVEPQAPAHFDWTEALGDGRRLPEWIGYFGRRVNDDGWEDVVAEWVPRLLPALAIALFHAAIRTGHAVRAIAAVDTEPRRAELARALGYWAARFRTGEPAGVDDGSADDLRTAASDAAASGAHRYLTRPNILCLHGVTGAMALELLADHLPKAATGAALAQVRAEQAALYRGVAPRVAPDPKGVPFDDLARSAAASGDPHQVKLVEACRRGLVVVGDPVFAVAAEVVTGSGADRVG